MHELKIDFAEKSAHGGVWKCVVLQPDLGLTWTTAVYHVEGAKIPISKYETNSNIYCIPVLPARSLVLSLVNCSVFSIIFKPIVYIFGESMVAPIFTLTVISALVLFCVGVKVYFRRDLRPKVI